MVKLILGILAAQANPIIGTRLWYVPEPDWPGRIESWPLNNGETYDWRTGCDWNGDGVYDSGDFFSLFADIAAGHGDFNHDLVTNDQDLFSYLRACQ